MRGCQNTDCIWFDFKIDGCDEIEKGVNPPLEPFNCPRYERIIARDYSDPFAWETMHARKVLGILKEEIKNNSQKKIGDYLGRTKRTKTRKI